MRGRERGRGEGEKEREGERGRERRERGGERREGGERRGGREGDEERGGREGEREQCKTPCRRMIHDNTSHSPRLSLAQYSLQCKIVAYNTNQLISEYIYMNCNS